MDSFWRFWDQLGAWQKLGLSFVGAVVILAILTMIF
jgi:hypothetical protein